MSTAEQPPDGGLDLRRLAKLAAILLCAVAAHWLPIGDLDPRARMCLSIFVAAAGLWVTEVIPAFATAVAVIVASVYLLGDPVGGDAKTYQAFLDPFASPVLVLFFGGFVLEAGATKHGLSHRLAKMFLKPFGTRPGLVLLGTILITGLFSMFMSNTATAAMMLAIMAPVLARLAVEDPFRRGLALAVPFAANLGGIGTIVGTPPNAVAVTNLAAVGERVTFAGWLAFGAPLAAFMLLALWGILYAMFRPRTTRFEVLFPEPLPVTRDLVVVAGTFLLTVVLWITEALHGIPAALAALLPVVSFTSMGILDRDDLRRLDWDVLILIAGGMALGEAMKMTGLSAALASGIGGSLPTPMLAVAALTVVGVLLSNFMSNTSAANLLVPIAISLSMDARRESAIVVALAVSMAMSLPIATPPNALACATRAFPTRDMMRAGAVVSLVGLAALAILSNFL